MIFYVESRIHFMQYEQLDGTIEYRGLIEAENLNQAHEKFKSYWANKTNKYYTVLELVIVESIT